ncbi:hypothetical protein [Segetibacter aerophilus]|uniref:Uncharacterized protein n=1 Tax=Segetibacter aerophilus TaxID=670293 RepID=A0A512BIJ4_9BACT|nr:hypothetical protein [Segetibacter aerophilus]GEO11786.1 hypothetical protein SAE01_42820 [Segetibacter aerophilus]
MKHYKDFIIKLQTLDIKTAQKRQDESRNPENFSIYVISHQNPYLSDTFRNELKELKELAVIDILNLSSDQIQLQLHRLGELREHYHQFWNSLKHSDVPVGSEHLTDLLYSLNLNELFIVPELSFQDHAKADDYFITDLQDSIRARQNALEEFEQSVFKATRQGKEAEKTDNIKPVKKEEPKPVFKESVIAELYELVKDYFKPIDHPQLKSLLTGEIEVEHTLAFRGAGNQLADAFKQLFEANLIIGCNKAQLISWIIEHFTYSDKGAVKNYSEKYLLDIISSNTKTCQSPILNVRKKDGQFVILPLQRNNRNNKT